MCLERAQSHFANGREARHGMPETLDRNPACDGDGGRLQQFGYACPDECGPEQMPVIEIDDQAGPPGVTVGVKVDTGDRIADAHIDDLHAVPPSFSLLGGEPDCGGLGVGEEHLRYCVRIGGRDVGAPRRSIELLSRGARTDGVARQANATRASSTSA